MIEFFFKNVSILSEFLIFQSNLFRSIIVEGKIVFLKRSCFTFIAGILLHCLVLHDIKYTNIHKKRCWTLFLVKLQAFRPAALLKSGSSAGVFLWMLQTFKNRFFYGTPLVAAFMSSRKGIIGKRGKKKQGKIFSKWKKRMKTFHLNFYLTTYKFWFWLKQKCKYSYINIRTAHHFFLTFSSNFISFDSCVSMFCIFIRGKPKNISCWMY